MFTIFILVLGTATAEFLYNNNYSEDTDLAELVNKLLITQPCSITIVDKLFSHSSLVDRIVKQLSSDFLSATIVTTLTTSSKVDEDSCQLYVLLWPSEDTLTVHHSVRIHA